MEFPTSPGPWTFGYTDDLQAPIIVDANDDVVCVMHDGVTTKDGKLMAAAPELLEVVKKRTENEEQRVFEYWLERVRPSGDHDAVQRQWLSSHEYIDFCDEWSEELDAIAKATGK